MRSRQGVTLLELLLAITLLGLFGAMVTSVLVAASRIAARATAQLALERTAQTLQAFLGQELRDGEWAELGLSAAAIALSRRVGSGEPCGAGVGTLLLRRAQWNGDRAPEAARDQIAVLADPSSAWDDAPLLAIVPASCPDGAAAWRLTASVASDSVRMIRVLEPVMLRRYRAGASDWLGLAPADGGSPVQPFAGPLRSGASRFARVGDLLQVELGTVAGIRAFTIPLGNAP